MTSEAETVSAEDVGMMPEEIMAPAVVYDILSARWADDEETAAHLETASLGAVIVTPTGDADGWVQFLSWHEAGGVVEPYEPLPEREPGPTVIPASVFFDRCTINEADEIDVAMMALPVKHRRAWAAATEFRSDTDLWPVLRGAIVDLYGEARADELLARP